MASLAQYSSMLQDQPSIAGATPGRRTRLVGLLIYLVLAMLICVAAALYAAS
jgi:hypothetical protein